MLKKGIALHSDDRHHDYEVGRFVGWASILPHTKKGKAPKSPDKFVKFEWEKSAAVQAAAESLKGVDLSELVRETFPGLQKSKSNG